MKPLSEITSSSFPKKMSITYPKEMKIHHQLFSFFNLQRFCGLKYVNFRFLGSRMAFVSKVGNMLKQTISNHVKLELAASKPSIYQAIRCMSSSKLFVGGK